MTPPRNKPFVVYWNNIPAPYMVERFNALADRGNLDFEAWFNDRIAPDRSWDVDESSWRFPYRYLPTLSIGRCRIHFPLPLFKRKRPDVLVSLYAEPVFLAGWFIARLCGVRSVFRVLVTFDRWVKRRQWKEWLKCKLFPTVDGIIVPGLDGRNFSRKYGVIDDKIFTVSHSIDADYFHKQSSEIRPIRDFIRDELGLCGCTFIYVGRLLRLKGADYLLDAFHHLQQKISEETSLLLVGDGNDEGLLKEKCKRENIRNVVFAGFRQKKELPRFYAIADVFVFPTLGDPYGLVVDEAMACSLPIISTSAAGEIKDRVEEGMNGFIVPPEDSVSLREAMESLAMDKVLRKRMGEISAQKIAGHTPEKWVDDFEWVVYKILGDRGDGYK